MALPKTTPQDLARHLTELGVRKGDHLAVHSRLISFGLIEGGVATVLEALLDAVGPQGTLIVPTYTLDTGTIYDAGSTPSQGVGALPEYLRQLDGAVRSACPMHNHAGLGARVEVLGLSDGTVSFGPGSDFTHLLDGDFQLLLLGTTITEGATYIHHVEAMRAVPYRTWLNLPRQIVRADGSTAGMICRYYGRTNPAMAENFDVLEPALRAARALTRVACPFGASRLVNLRDLHTHASAALTANPYALVNTP